MGPTDFMQQMLGNRVAPGQNPFNIGGYRVNYMGLNPNISEQLSRFFFPNMKQAAPPTMLQSQYDELSRMSSFRNQMRQTMTAQSAVAGSTARAALSAVFGNERASEIVKGLNSNAMSSLMFNSGFRMMFGGGGVEAARADSLMKMQRYYSGFQMDRGPGGSGPTFGMNVKELMGLDRSLFSATYSDRAGLKRRNSFFGIGEMADIAMMGTEYGAPVQSPGQIVNQAKSMAGMIQAGMGIYETLNKEGVVSKIMELTRGQTQITDTSRINSMLYKLKSIAKATNTSIDAVQQISAETSSVLDNLGLSTNMSVDIAGSSLALTRNLGMGGSNPIFNSRRIDALGGRAKFRRTLEASNVGVITSSRYVNTALAYYNAGAFSDDPSAARRDIIANFRQGKGVSTSIVNQIEKKFLESEKQYYLSLGMSEGEAVAAAQASAPGAIERARQDSTNRFTGMMNRSRGGVDLARSNSLANLREIITTATGSSGTAQTLISSAQGGNKKTTGRILDLVTNYYRQLDPNMSLKDAQMQAETYRLALADKGQRKRIMDAERFMSMDMTNAQAGEMLRGNGMGLMNVFASILDQGDLSNVSGLTSFVARSFAGLEDQFYNNYGMVKGSMVKDSQLSAATLGSFQDEYVGWSANKALGTQRKAFQAISGMRSFSREDIFGDTGMYRNIRKAIGAKKRRFDGVDAANAAGISGTIIDAREIYKKIGDTRLSFKDFAGYLKDSGSNLSMSQMMNNEGVVQSYVDFLNTVDRVAPGDDRGRQKLTFIQTALKAVDVSSQGGKFTKVNPFTDEEKKELVAELNDDLVKKGILLEGLSPEDSDNLFRDYVKKFTQKSLDARGAAQEKRYSDDIKTFKENRKSLSKDLTKSLRSMNGREINNEEAKRIKKKYGSRAGNLIDYSKNIMDALESGDMGKIEGVVRSFYNIKPGDKAALPDGQTLTSLATTLVMDAEKLNYAKTGKGVFSERMLSEMDFNRDGSKKVAAQQIVSKEEKNKFFGDMGVLTEKADWIDAKMKTLIDETRTIRKAIPIGQTGAR